MSLIALYKNWQKFFFEPRSPLPMAIFRILLGLIVLQDLLIMIMPDFKFYYGDNAVVPVDQMMTHWFRLEPCFDLMLLLPPGEQWRYGFFVVMVVLAVMMLLGLFFRFSSVALWLCFISIDNQFELNQNSGDVFVRLAVMIICMSNAGDALSLDNLIAATKQDWRKTGFGVRLSAPWAQRALQLQLSWVYLHTFICKLQGKEWIDGTACYFASRYEEMQRFPVPFIFENIWTIKILTYFTLGVEFALFTLIWFKETRYWVLLGGLFLHLGIEYSTNLPMFEWLFMFTYIVFVEPEDLERFFALLRAKATKMWGAPKTVAYDGRCLSCVRTVGVLHRLDFLHRIEFVDRGENAPHKHLFLCNSQSDEKQLAKL